jgi:hypothetical protein
MSTTTAQRTNRSIAQPDTSRETRIGWKGGSEQWTEKDENSYWEADYLYLRKGKHYQHLDQIDGGFKNGPRWWNQTYFTNLSNWDLITILSDNLDLSTEERQLAVGYFIRQDLQKWGIRKELVAWSVCSYIVHSNEQNCRQCHPLTPDEESDELFQQAAESLDLPFNARVKTWAKVENDYRLNW